MGLKVTLVKSVAGSSADQRATVVGLGLGKFGDSRVVKDTPAIRGMVFKVKHLVTQEVVKEDPKARKRLKPRIVRARELARKSSATAK